MVDKGVGWDEVSY